MELQLDKILSYTGTLSKYKLRQVYVVFAYWVKKKITVKDKNRSKNDKK